MLKPKATDLNPPEASPTTPAAAPRIIPRSDHAISRSHISPNALRVLNRLRDAGFMGFLVGGCVRDLLIGIEPKDFDVATDALPEQIKRLFRNSRLVGRRFRLAHVFFGRDIIEVATFRAATAPSQGDEPLPEADPEDGEAPELDEGADESADIEPPEPVRAAPGARAAVDDDDPNADRRFDASGRILRDNVYGTIDEDVWRRDFTANALYYNIADFSLWDYVNGAQDIAARTLRLIGDPETRYREDPVRMLRAARFEAKLGFTIEPATAQPIGRLRELLAGVPPARLFEETLKLFLRGHGARSFEVLRRRGLLAALLPSVDAYFSTHPGSLVEKLLLQGLRNTDERVLADKPVTPTFLFALLLYGPIAGLIEAAPPERWHELATILEACDRAMRQAQTRLAIPSASRSGCARCSRCSRASSIRAGGARCARSSTRAFAPPTTCCCCAPSTAWRRRTWRSGGPGCRRCRRRSAGAWPMRSRARGPRVARRVRAGAAVVVRVVRRAPPDKHMDRWQPAYIGVGSNLQDPRRQVNTACARLADLPRTRLVLTSRLYASRPFGPVSQPDFVNAVAGLLTQLDPEGVLRELRALESAMGRTAPRERWGPRIIDLDLLALGSERRSLPSLTLPHPGIVERNFVLYPLSDIAPDLELPGMGRVAELKRRVTNDGLTLV